MILDTLFGLCFDRPAPMPVLLATDLVMAAIAALCAIFAVLLRRRPALAARWKLVVAKPSAAASLVVLAFFLGVALLDSVHYRKALAPAGPGAPAAYAPATTSLLDDLIFEGLGAARPERSYSAPMAVREFDKSTVLTEKGPVRDFQPLRNIGRHPDGTPSTTGELGMLGLAGIVSGAAAALLALLADLALRRPGARPIREAIAGVVRRPERLAPRVVFVFLAALAGAVIALWPERHLLGTDAVGTDVLYESLKSIRTAIVIGSLATAAALPFAVALGLAAGYFRGWIDDVVQYVYTTLSSIPSVLLIAASALMTTAFMDKHPEFWPTGLERADMRLFLLAVIIGATGWATLARLIRAETMRIAALDYVRAARALGVPAWAMLLRHILPNVMHIILIVAVLDFSSIVLYEAVLSYVGVGVDPSMNSFGTMINAARSEMSRSPMVWWNLLGAFLFLVTFVLCANLFAAAVREAFDPRARHAAEEDS